MCEMGWLHDFLLIPVTIVYFWNKIFLGFDPFVMVAGYIKHILLKFLGLFIDFYAHLKNQYLEL